MPAVFALCIVFPVFKWKCDISNCSHYRAIKLLEYGMKVVPMALKKRLHSIVTVLKIYSQDIFKIKIYFYNPPFQQQLLN